MAVSRRRAWIELGAMILTGAGFLVFENLLGLKVPYLLAAIAAWVAYAVTRMCTEPRVLDEWGLRLHRLRPAAREALICLAVGVALLAAWRLARGWKPLPRGALAVLAIYPVWAFIQQFVVQGLIAGNLERLGAPRAVLFPVAALLFGAAHAPDWPLALICAVAGLAWTWLFLRTRTLYPLALCHAWLGTLAFYWVLERDPWLEFLPAGS